MGSRCLTCSWEMYQRNQESRVAGMEKLRELPKLKQMLA